MKRPLSDFSDEEREEAVARAKLGAASPPPSFLAEYKTLSEQSDYFKRLMSEVYIVIDRAFDVGVNPRKGKHTKVEFMLPRSLAVPILLAPLAENQITPTSMVLTRFSHQKQTTVLEVRLSWKIKTMEVAMAILGDRFAPRPYADPDGTVNFDPNNGERISGGYLTPEIEPEQPLILTYYWDAQGVQLEFYVQKTQATRTADGSVEFRVTAI